MGEFLPFMRSRLDSRYPTSAPGRAIDYPCDLSDSVTRNFAAAELSREERELISHRNAERLLKLPPR